MYIRFRFRSSSLIEREGGQAGSVCMAYAVRSSNVLTHTAYCMPQRKRQWACKQDHPPVVISRY